MGKKYLGKTMLLIALSTTLRGRAYRHRLRKYFRMNLSWFNLVRLAL